MNFTRWSIKACLALVSLAAGAVCAAASPAAVPRVAAASDLRFAIEEIAARFEADTKRRVSLALGSSGNFYTQIRQGAPFELFLSADEDFIFSLADAGRAEDRGALYATGRLVLFAAHGSPLKVDEELKGLRQALSEARIRRFAIANPAHAPYGRAAEEALQALGLWETVRPRLVFGENVSQAAQFAMSGSAQGGIFAYSLAFAPAVSSSGTYALLPERLHRPLRQRMALIKGAGETARNFYAYLQQPAARAVFRRYGFALPGE
jgi:molybdate transport system substrate-binding protein